jgi:hypothetical protein
MTSDFFIWNLLRGVARCKKMPPQTIARSEDSTRCAPVGSVPIRTVAEATKRGFLRLFKAAYLTFGAATQRLGWCP